MILIQKICKQESINIFYMIFIVVISLLFSSCNRYGKFIEKDISSLTSRSTVIPNDIYVTINGRDTLINDFLNSKIKMVIYTNSESCSSCSINKLFMWGEYVKYVEQFNGDMKYYFIFNPPKGENIRLALKNSLLDYPVLLDSLGEFERLNPHLPKNIAMHTFLLDENNNVILVGNPLQNKQIEKMFYEEVEKRLK